MEVSKTSLHMKTTVNFICSLNYYYPSIGYLPVSKIHFKFRAVALFVQKRALEGLLVVSGLASSTGPEEAYTLSPL